MWIQWVSHPKVWITFLKNKNISRISASASWEKHEASIYPPQKKKLGLSKRCWMKPYFLKWWFCSKRKRENERILQTNSRITSSGEWGLNCTVRKYSHFPLKQLKQKQLICFVLFCLNRLRKVLQIQHYISGKFKWCYWYGWKLTSEKIFLVLLAPPITSWLLTLSLSPT